MSYKFNPFTENLDIVDISDLTGYLPYTGATGDLNLGTHDLTTTGDITCGTLNYTTLNPPVSISPGGSDTQIQFNDSGSFGGDSGLIYNKSTDTLTTTNIVTDSITMGLDEVITQNSETLKHNGTHHTFSDSISCGGTAAGQSSIQKGLVVNDGAYGDADADFRAETNSEPNAFVVDASAEQILMNVTCKLAYLGSAPGSLSNGMIWMESDGLHLYYNNAEKVVAGA